MVNNGQTFYGRIKRDVGGGIEFEDDRIIEYVDEEDITKAVLERFPTLKNRKFQVLFNN